MYFSRRISRRSIAVGHSPDNGFIFLLLNASISSMTKRDRGFFENRREARFRVAIESEAEKQRFHDPHPRPEFSSDREITNEVLGRYIRFAQRLGQMEDWLRRQSLDLLSNDRIIDMIRELDIPAGEGNAREQILEFCQWWNEAANRALKKEGDVMTQEELIGDKSVDAEVLAARFFQRYFHEQPVGRVEYERKGFFLVLYVNDKADFQKTLQKSESGDTVGFFKAQTWVAEVHPLLDINEYHVMYQEENVPLIVVRAEKGAPEAEFTFEHELQHALNFSVFRIPKNYQRASDVHSSQEVRRLVITDEVISHIRSGDPEHFLELYTEAVYKRVLESCVSETDGNPIKGSREDWLRTLDDISTAMKELRGILEPRHLYTTREYRLVAYMLTQFPIERFAEVIRKFGKRMADTFGEHPQ